MSLLYSEDELKKFIGFLPQLSLEEAWYVALSSRNKYLTAEERVLYHLGSAEMFVRELVYKTDIANFLFIIKTLDKQLEYRQTRSGMLFPAHATTIYFNINPVSGLKAFFEFQKEMNKEVSILTLGLRDGNDVSVNLSRFRNSLSILRTCFQKARSRKVFVDIDFDVKHVANGEKFVNEFEQFCAKNKICYFVIETKSGYHVCVDRETIKCNIQEKAAELNSAVTLEGDGKGEVMINKNDMIPLPGTLQAGFKVKVVRTNFD